MLFIEINRSIDRLREWKKWITSNGWNYIVNQQSMKIFIIEYDVMGVNWWFQSRKIGIDCFHTTAPTTTNYVLNQSRIDMSAKWEKSLVIWQKLFSIFRSASVRATIAFFRNQCVPLGVCGCEGVRLRLLSILYRGDIKLDPKPNYKWHRKSSLELSLIAKGSFAHEKID